MIKDCTTCKYYIANDGCDAPIREDILCCVVKDLNGKTIYRQWEALEVGN